MGTAGEVFCSWWERETGRVYSESVGSTEPQGSGLLCFFI